LFVRRIVVLGKEHVRHRATILVSNHARVSDPIIIGLLFGPGHSLIQGESFFLPVVGRVLARSGQIPLTTGQPVEALGLAAECLQRGRPFLIYPEGRLSHGGELLRGKTGAARLAFRSGAPIQPLAVHVPETYVRTFRGRAYNRETIGRWQIGGSAFVAVGPPWRPFPPGMAEASPMQLRKVTDEMMARVRDLLTTARAAA
jgi:1-acyl-sn-glycerol-3-phosphate acyltransferase